MKNVIYTGKDQDFQNETTTYWFNVDVDGETETFGVAEKSAGEVAVLDCDGAPVDYNEHTVNEVLANCIVTDEMRAE